METAQMVEVAREEVEAFNDADWDRFRATLAPDAVYEEFATQRHVEGADEILEVNKQWRDAFPDAHGTITSEVASGDTVTLEITWEGTQSGALQSPAGEIPASNQHISVKAAQVMKFSNSHIKETHHYFDLMGMLQQIGAA